MQGESVSCRVCNTERAEGKLLVLGVAKQWNDARGVINKRKGLRCTAPKCDSVSFPSILPAVFVVEAEFLPRLYGDAMLLAPASGSISHALTTG